MDGSNVILWQDQHLFSMLFGDIIKGVRVSYGNSWWWSPHSLTSHSRPLMYFDEKNLEPFFSPFVVVVGLLKSQILFIVCI
jgi:hypothetical protein